MGARFGLALVVVLGIAWSAFGAVTSAAAAPPAPTAAATPAGGKLPTPTPLPPKLPTPMPLPPKGFSATGLPPKGQAPTAGSSRPALPAIGSQFTMSNTLTLTLPTPNRQLPPIQAVGGAGGEFVAVTLADGSTQILPASTFAKSSNSSADCIRDTLAALHQLSPASSDQALLQAATAICQRQAAN